MDYWDIIYPCFDHRTNWVVDKKRIMCFRRRIHNSIRINYICNISDVWSLRVVLLEEVIPSSILVVNQDEHGKNKINLANKKCQETLMIKQENYQNYDTFKQLKDIRGQVQIKHANKQFPIDLNQLVTDILERVNNKREKIQNQSFLNINSQQTPQKIQQKQIQFQFETDNLATSHFNLDNRVNTNNNNNATCFTTINQQSTFARSPINRINPFDLNSPIKCVKQSQLYQQQQQLEEGILNSEEEHVQSLKEIGDFSLCEEHSFQGFCYKGIDIKGEKFKRYYDITLVECVWEGKSSVMIMLTDVTQKMYCQWLEEVQGYKDLMLAQITHDLRTPLNGIICQLQSTTDFKTIQEYSTCINLTLKSSFLLLSVINDILDHSQMMKGQLKLTPDYFSISTLIDDVIDLLKPQATKKNLYLKQKIINKSFNNNNYQDCEQFQNYEQSEIIIYNDQNRIKQILLNLIGNALKFTFKGGITILVEEKPFDQYQSLEYSLFYRESQQKYYRISVTDTGVGVPVDIRDKIFTIYGTYDHVKGNNKHGMGLGLTICKQLAGLVGPNQNLELDTKVNSGSCFSFKIYSNIDPNRQMQKFNSRTAFNFESSTTQFMTSRQPQQDKTKGPRYSNQMAFKNNTIKLQQSMQFVEKFVSQENIYCDTDEIQQEDFSKSIPLYIDYNLNSSQIREQNISPYSTPSDNCILTKRNTSRSILSKVEEEKTLIAQLLPKNKFKILVVDDNPFNIIGLQSLFRFIKNISFDEAYNGEQGAEKVIENSNAPQDQQYYLIFMDVNMPIMDGNEAISKIRREIKGKIDYKIISLTAFGQEQDKEKCIQAGADYFMNKPVTYSNLIIMLKHLIENNNSF